MLFSWTFFLCGVTFWASLRCGKAYGSSKLMLQLNFFHNLFIVCIGKAFTQRMLLVPDTAKSVESSTQNSDKMEA